MDSKSLIQALETRYATKSFDTDFVLSDEMRQTIYEVLRLSPSSFGLQPWKFVIVENKELRQELCKASFNQVQVTEASLMLVLCRYDQFTVNDVKRYVKSVAETRGQTEESLAGYGKMMEGFVESKSAQDLAVWMEKQIYIALGNVMTSVATLGLDACPIEGFNRAEYDRILNLPAQNLRSIVVCPIGKRNVNDKYATAPKVRYKKEDLFVTI